jgi:dienelactone hydrolase
MKVLRIFVVAILLLEVVVAKPIRKAPFNKQRVTYTNGKVKLVGVVYKPDGPGPFPTIIWNHGSETDPEGGRRFDTVAEIFVPEGYVVFAPIRRGHGPSSGEYIVDTVRAMVRQTGSTESYGRFMVHLLETEQLDDQFTGISYAKKLPFVDASRLMVAGCSFGGIQTLLAAERDVSLKAAFPISPAALTWDVYPEMQNRLIAAVRNITIPVLLIQPPNDDSLNPARVLGEEARKAGKASFNAKIYPATMRRVERGHCFGGATGMHNWAAEAVTFFAGALGRQ